MQYNIKHCVSSLEANFGVIQCTCSKSACTSKTVAHKAKGLTYWATGHMHAIYLVYVLISRSPGYVGIITCLKTVHSHNSKFWNAVLGAKKTTLLYQVPFTFVVLWSIYSVIQKLFNRDWYVTNCRPHSEQTFGFWVQMYWASYIFDVSRLI